MFGEVVKWGTVALFVGLANTDNLQPQYGDPIVEAGRRVVQAGEVLFAGGCTHVFRCEKVLKDAEPLKDLTVKITEIPHHE